MKESWTRITISMDSVHCFILKSKYAILDIGRTTTFTASATCLTTNTSAKILC